MFNEYTKVIEDVLELFMKGYGYKNEELFDAMWESLGNEMFRKLIGYII